MQPKIKVGQDQDDQELALQKSRAGLLTASTTDLWCQIFLYYEADLCVGGSLLAASMELCPHTVAPTLPRGDSQNVSRHCQVCLEGRITCLRTTELR